jgi:hypothetical protein
MTRIRDNVPTPEGRLKVYTEPGPNGCIDWIGGRSYAGYGRSCLDGRQVSAHHLALIVAGRELPTKGYHVDHLCGRPQCVNVDHLEVVPHAVNVQRGRAAKLDPKQVSEIRRRYAQQSLDPWQFAKGVAVEYGVHASTVKRIVTGQGWKNVEVAA